MDLLARDLAKLNAQFEPRGAKFLFRCHEKPAGLLVDAEERAAMIEDFRRAWQTVVMALTGALVIEVVAAVILLPMLELPSEVKLALIVMVALILYVAGRRWLSNVAYQSLVRQRKAGLAAALATPADPTED
jgi:hypothetical protein